MKIKLFLIFVLPFFFDQCSPEEKEDSSGNLLKAIDDLQNQMEEAKSMLPDTTKLKSLESENFNTIKPISLDISEFNDSIKVSK